MARKNAGSINVDFDAKTAGLRRAEGEVRRTANTISNNFRRARTQTQGLTGDVQRLRGALGRLSAVGAGLTGGFLGGLGRHAVQDSAAIVELGLRSGEATRELLELRIALEGEGLDASRFPRFVANWSRVVTEAASGSEEYAATFRQLDVDINRISLLPLQQQMLAVAEATEEMAEAGRNFEASGLLAQLVGARNIPVATAFFERGRLQRNLEAAREIPIATTEQLRVNKDLLQDFTNLSNALRQSLISAVNDAAPAISRFLAVLQENAPAAVRAGVSAFPGAVQTGAAVAGGALFGSFVRQITIFFTAIRNFGTLPGGASALIRSTAWIAAISVAVGELYGLFTRFQRIQEITQNPIDLSALGDSIEAQREAVLEGLFQARFELARLNMVFEDQGTYSSIWEALNDRLSGETVNFADVDAAEADVNRWLVALEQVDAARSRLSTSTEDAVETVASTVNEMAGLIESIDEVFALRARFSQEFRNPRYDIASRLLRDPNAGRTLDLEGLQLRQPGITAGPTPFHVLGDARQLEQEFRVHEMILVNVAQSAGDALGDFVDAITDETQGFREAMAAFLRSLSRAITSGIGAGLTDRLLGGLGLRAAGGYASGLTLVGERGPELLDFANPAMVYSSAQLGAAIRGGGGGGVTINNNQVINAVDAVGVSGVLRQHEARMMEQIEATLLLRSGYSNPISQRFGQAGI